MSIEDGRLPESASPREANLLSAFEQKLRQLSIDPPRVLLLFYPSGLHGTVTPEIPLYATVLRMISPHPRACPPAHDTLFGPRTPPARVQGSVPRCRSCVVI